MKPHAKIVVLRPTKANNWVKRSTFWYEVCSTGRWSSPSNTNDGGMISTFTCTLTPTLWIFLRYDDLHVPYIYRFGSLAFFVLPDHHGTVKTRFTLLVREFNPYVCHSATYYSNIPCNACFIKLQFESIPFVLFRYIIVNANKASPSADIML